MSDFYTKKNLKGFIRAVVESNPKKAEEFLNNVIRHKLDAKYAEACEACGDSHDEKKKKKRKKYTSY